jgi:hypothetical protein
MTCYVDSITFYYFKPAFLNSDHLLHGDNIKINLGEMGDVRQMNCIMILAGGHLWHYYNLGLAFYCCGGGGGGGGDSSVAVAVAATAAAAAAEWRQLTIILHYIR